MVDEVYVLQELGTEADDDWSILNKIWILLTKIVFGNGHVDEYTSWSSLFVPSSSEAFWENKSLQSFGFGVIDYQL